MTESIETKDKQGGVCRGVGAKKTTLKSAHMGGKKRRPTAVLNKKGCERSRLFSMHVSSSKICSQLLRFWVNYYS
jgi:hypothetical protein